METDICRITTFWNFWKCGNVREFCTGQEKVRKGIKSGKGQEFV